MSAPADRNDDLNIPRAEPAKRCGITDLNGEPCILLPGHLARRHMGETWLERQRQIRRREIRRGGR